MTFLFLVLVASSVSAQTDEQRAAARSLATEGASAFQAGRYKDAVDLFGKAETLVHAPPHLLFLARSHTKLGQFVKARESYLKIIKEVLPANAPQAFRDAQAAASEEIKAVEPKIASLTVTVEGAEGAQELQVLVNGAPMPSVLIGAPRPIDPGEHQLEARAQGFLAKPVRVKLGDGERKAVALKLEPAPGAAPVPTTGAPAPEPAVGPAPVTAGTPPDRDQGTPPADDKSGLRIGSYVAFGVGVLGVAAGTVFTLQSSSKRKEADDKFDECGSDGCLVGDPRAAEGDELDRDADSALTLGIVGFAVGGVGLAAGTTLFILSSGGSGETASGVTPYVGFGSAGLRGRF